MRTDFVFIPVEDVVKQTPNHLMIPVDHQFLHPQVSRTKPILVFQETEDFLKVAIDSR